MKDCGQSYGFKSAFLAFCCACILVVVLCKINLRAPGLPSWELFSGCSDGIFLPSEESHVLAVQSRLFSTINFKLFESRGKILS